MEFSNNKTYNTKKSAGIACCRQKTDSLEILLVKKRYSYHFVSFVFGQYNKKDNDRLKFLFNGMTLQEKIDILSLRFDILWHKIWLRIPEVIMFPDDLIDFTDINSIAKTWDQVDKFKRQSSKKTARIDFYLKKKNKFELNFVIDNGKRLRSLITGTLNNQLQWEIPKGRKHRKESIVQCAIREFKEETNMVINIEDIIDTKPIINIYTSLDTKYIHRYYCALTTSTFEPICIFTKDTLSPEIDNVKWMSRDEIKYVDHAGFLISIVDAVFENVKLKII